MKKNLVGIIAAAVVIALVGTVGGIALWFGSPGVRVFGGSLHAEINQIGYTIDPATGKIVGQTPINIDGSTSHSDPELFDGDSSMPAYKNDVSGTLEITRAIEVTDSGFYIIRQLEKCTHEETVDEITKDVEHLCDNYYTYYLYPEKKDFLIGLVEQFEENTPIYVVCADSEAEALETYNWFLANKPE